MIQGTSSDAGKSLLAAALCRIFSQDGLTVAPFKSQNMALNSCVTPDGLEMGRAQALQAAACRRPPDVRMNPVLLKPTSDMGSQVVVMGKAVGLMRVRDYWEYKPRAFGAACDAYDSLASEVDVMVLEGAGSPAEINLRSHDIVNMAMAAHAGAEVLLAGDIDRGGVFASLVGTLALLDDADRARIAGLVINKFRGDASLLPPALEAVTERTGKPFFGIVPWVSGLNLPDEDSVSFKAGQACSPDANIHGARTSAGRGGVVDVALVDLPRISNFTDMDALAAEPDVCLRVVRRRDDLGRPDVIIVPGSKNTLADLYALREEGTAEALLKLACAADGPVVVGICGGLQMLGRTIGDPQGVEEGGSASGLGLLPLETALAPEKTLRRVRAVCRAVTGLRLSEPRTVEGYEIHHGRTVPLAESVRPWITAADGETLGWSDETGRVCGSYVHGLFDADAFRRAFLDAVRVRKGLEPVLELTPYTLEPSLERLAEAVRSSLDMRAVYRLIGR